MNNNTQRLVEEELSFVLESKNTRPYVFRTRLERTLERLLAYATSKSLVDLKDDAKLIKHKIIFISDQSNQTSDGTLKSYSYLENDIKALLEKVRAS